MLAEGEDQWQLSLRNLETLHFKLMMFFNFQNLDIHIDLQGAKRWMVI